MQWLTVKMVKMQFFPVKLKIISIQLIYKNIDNIATHSYSNSSVPDKLAMK